MTKQIDWGNISRKNGYTIDQFIERGVDMEFIKYGDKYIIKDSPGIIVDEEEKLKLEKNELVLKDIEGCGCQEKTTKRITEIDKELKEIKKSKKK